MNINPDRLREFSRVYQEEFGERLSERDAREMLTRLMTLYELLVRSLPDKADDIGDVVAKAARSVKSGS